MAEGAVYMGEPRTDPYSPYIPEKAKNTDTQSTEVLVALKRHHSQGRVRI
jgi:hypothetical protein